MCYHQLRIDGIGAFVKHAMIVTPEEENMLWETKVIGDHSPLALLRAVFYYIGKCYCIRGGKEQRSLKRSQFLRSSGPDCYTFIENGSKNRPGTSIKEVNKVVPVYASFESKPRCLVYLLDTYFAKWPPEASEKDYFYLRPKKIPKENVWYDCSPVGQNSLKKCMKQMCSEAGVSGKKTNHSLRATGASALFNAGVPEKMIRDVTGHRSSALLQYERPNLEQKQAVSQILVQGGKGNIPASSTSPASTSPIPSV